MIPNIVISYYKNLLNKNSCDTNSQWKIISENTGSSKKSEVVKIMSENIEIIDDPEEICKN